EALKSNAMPIKNKPSRFRLFRSNISYTPVNCCKKPRGLPCQSGTLRSTTVGFSLGQLFTHRYFAVFKIDLTVEVLDADSSTDAFVEAVGRQLARVHVIAQVTVNHAL